MPKVILLRSQNSSRVGYRGYVEDFGSFSQFKRTLEDVGLII